MVSGEGAHIVLGDAIVGVEGAAHSAKESANLADWDRATSEDWRARSPFAAFSAAERERLFPRDVADCLPHLGGRSKAKNIRFHSAPSIRIQLPTLSKDVARAISRRDGTLGAAVAYIRDHTAPLVDSSIAQSIACVPDLPRLSPPSRSLPGARFAFSRRHYLDSGGRWALF